MTETLTFLDIFIYNVATPLVISGLAIWIFTDSRRVRFSKMIKKPKEKIQ